MKRHNVKSKHSNIEPIAHHSLGKVSLFITFEKFCTHAWNGIIYTTLILIIVITPRNGTKRIKDKALFAFFSLIFIFMERKFDKNVLFSQKATKLGYQARFKGSNY